MVGDRWDTGIVFGNDGGISTALVFTGVGQVEDVADLPQGGMSTLTYLFENLGSLLRAAEGVAACARSSGTAKTAQAVSESAL